MTTCIIVDIDGTLSDSRHRLHHLQSKPKNWPAFFDEMVNDPPYQWVVDLVRLLARDHLIMLASGRPDSHQPQTIEWLGKQGVPWTELHMRKTGDYRLDTIVKKEILDKIILF